MVPILKKCIGLKMLEFLHNSNSIQNNLTVYLKTSCGSTRHSFALRSINTNQIFCSCVPKMEFDEIEIIQWKLLPTRSTADSYTKKFMVEDKYHL